MDSRLRCRSFRTYTGQRKPRCNGRNPCVACSLLHFLVYLNAEERVSLPLGYEKRLVEDYIRSNP